MQILQQRLKADHGALTRLINPERGFKTLPTASATIKGFEVMRTIRKRLCLILESGTTEECDAIDILSGCKQRRAELKKLKARTAKRVKKYKITRKTQMVLTETLKFGYEVCEDAVDDIDGGIVRAATPIMKDVAAVTIMIRTTE